MLFFFVVFFADFPILTSIAPFCLAVSYVKEAFLLRNVHAFKRSCLRYGSAAIQLSFMHTIIMLVLVYGSC